MTHITGRAFRRIRIRKKIFGTAKIPRLVAYRSLKNMYAQLVDDLNHKTVLSASTNMPDLRKELKTGGNVKAAAALGEYMAQKALGKGISHIVFDRCGYKFHGRIKALADSARKAGLSFGKEKSAKDLAKKEGAKIKREEEKAKKIEVKTQRNVAKTEKEEAKKEKKVRMEKKETKES